MNIFNEQLKKFIHIRQKKNVYAQNEICQKSWKNDIFRFFYFYVFFLPMALLKSFHLTILRFSRYLKNIVKVMHIDFCAEILINKKVIAVLLTKGSDKKRKKL